MKTPVWQPVLQALDGEQAVVGQVSDAPAENPEKDKKTEQSENFGKAKNIETAENIETVGNIENADRAKNVDKAAYYAQNLVRMSLITVDPSRIEEYKAYVSEVGRLSMACEPGVRVLYSVQEKRDPSKFMILEIYASKEAYQKHIQSEHFQKYKQGTLDMVTSLDLVDCWPLVPEGLIKP